MKATESHAVNDAGFLASPTKGVIHVKKEAGKCDEKFPEMKIVI